MECDRVLQYIYKKIESKELVSGSKLPTERSLSEKLGVGRNSTREAISILQGMGLIESRQGSGNYICRNFSEPTEKMIGFLLNLGTITKEDVCEYRRAMEKSICLVLAKNVLSEDKRKRFESVLAAMESSEGKDESEVDSQFHELLVFSVDNPLFLITVSSVMPVFSQWIEVVLSKATDEDKKELVSLHKGIYKGIIANDIAMINSNIDRHYDLILKYLGE